jgi:hypothetical protein
MHRMRRSILVKFRSSLMAFFTTVLLVSLDSASAGGNDPLSPSPVRPGNLDYRIELPQGYLTIYSVSDELNDGAYYAHSSYAIYSTDGTLVKAVENNISRSDEIIPWEVALPIGSYTVVARSQRSGGVRVHFVIKADQQTIVQAIRNFSILPRLA